MAKGDVNDVLSRINALLPPGWFKDDSRILKSILSACATSLSWCYGLYIYARQQTRLSTTSDGWLDLAAYDFYGERLNRQAGMTDERFRLQIKTNLLRERGTRQAISDVIETLTGHKPVLFEPARPADTGSYRGPSIGYGVAGRYGSCRLPCQAFVTVTRPRSQGIPSVAGYRTSSAGYHTASRAQYVSAQMITGRVTDEQIYAAIEAVKPEGTQVWVRIN